MLDGRWTPQASQQLGPGGCWCQAGRALGGFLAPAPSAAAATQLHRYGQVCIYNHVLYSSMIETGMTTRLCSLLAQLMLACCCTAVPGWVPVSHQHPNQCYLQHHPCLAVESPALCTQICNMPNPHAVRYVGSVIMLSSALMVLQQLLQICEPGSASV